MLDLLNKKGVVTVKLDEKQKAAMNENAAHVMKKRAFETFGATFDVHGKVVHRDPNAFYIFPHTCTLRKHIIWFTEWKWFDRFITLVILVNSILLAIRDYEARLKGADWPSPWND